MKNVAPETYLTIGDRIRTEILAEYADDTCIAAVRATLDLLKALRVDAYALPVICMVANRALFEYADRTGSYPEIGSPDYPKGGYGVGVGFGTQEEKAEGHWAGHLVAIAERRWLLDYSIDQAARSGAGTVIGPVVVPVTEAWLRGSPRLLSYQKGNTRLHYARKLGPDAEGYRASSHWEGEHAPNVSVRQNNDPARVRSNRRRLVR